MKTLLSLISAVVIACTLQPETAQARAGTLISCEGVSTPQGYRYVGIYCVDYQCKYTTTRIFNSYCPFSL
jgi:hypothetical protein